MDQLTVGFMGSGRFAARCLEIISRRLRPMWVLTNAPRTAGRGLKLQNTPVWELAQSLDLPVYTTARLSADAERLEWLRQNSPDVILVIDFGQMIKEPVLSMAPLGCLNINTSKLPEYSGSATIKRALKDGRTKTAVSIFRLDAGMDSGPVLAQPELAIEPEDDAAALMEKAAVLGSETLLHYLCGVAPAEWRFTPQKEENVTTAPKIDKSEGKIDWRAESAEEIINKIRGIGCSPGVYCMVHGKRLRVHAAEPLPSAACAVCRCEIVDGAPVVVCREGALKLVEVQPEGKRPQRAEDWARGARIENGEEIG